MFIGDNTEIFNVICSHLIFQTIKARFVIFQ